MASVKEIVAADKLALSLEQTGEKMAIDLSKSLKVLIENPTVTDADIRKFIAKNIFTAAGKQSAIMAEFLRESLGTEVFIEFAEPNAKGVYVGSAQMLNKIYEDGSLAHAAMSKSVLTEYVLNQVDATQAKAGKSIKWRRHVDAKGCKWCRDQVSKFEQTGKFFRHPNCHCVKVRK